MSNNIYFCKKCYDNHDMLIRIFAPSFTMEWFGKCDVCGNTNLQKLSLTDEDYDVIEKITDNPDYVLSIERIKKESNLTDEEFLNIIKINCDKDFIIAMNNLKRTDIIDFNLKLSQMKPLKSNNDSTPSQPQPSATPQPKCPTCGSSDIKKISATKRWVGVGMFGLASSDVGKTMQCNNCGYKW